MLRLNSRRRKPFNYENVKAALIRVVGTANFSEDFIEIPYIHLETYADVTNNRAAMKNRKLVVRPKNIQEVSKIMKIATKYRVSVVPVAGSTSFYVSGGPVPTSRLSIVVDLRLMNEIMELNERVGTVKVQAGVTLGRLKEYLATANLWYPHLPESIQSATVGGAISFNGISPFATKYGRGGEQFVKLKVVLADGSVCDVGNRTNFDNSISLKKLFSASEGALGIIVEATLKIYQRPAVRISKLYGFPKIEDACQVVKDISEAGLFPEVIMMPSSERVYNEAMLAIVGPDPETLKQREYFLFVVYAGEENIVRFSVDKTMLIVYAVGGSIVADERVADSYWRNLTEVGAVVTEQMAKTYKGLKYNSIRPGVPVGILPDFVSDIKESFPRFSHLTYCGVTSYIFLPELDALPIFGMLLNDEDQLAVAEFNDFLSEATKVCKRLDGTIAAVGGFGTMLGKFTSQEMGSSEHLARAIKESFDPQCVMNPGKMLPR
jgi:glycolate oxidase